MRGRGQRGWYDRKPRRVRDLGDGGLGIYLEIEVRRVACRCCQNRSRITHTIPREPKNKICVIQRRAYGLRDEEYLRLKVLTCMLPQG